MYVRSVRTSSLFFVVSAADPANANDLPNSKDASRFGHNFDHFPLGRRSIERSPLYVQIVLLRVSGLLSLAPLFRLDEPPNDHAKNFTVVPELPLNLA